MAVKVNTEAMEEQENQEYTPETKHIVAGTHGARLVYYAELGKHTPIFKGAKATYDKGKRAGQVKDPELIIHLVFEFSNCPYDNNPLTIETSIPWKGHPGEFLNKLPVTDALASGNISMSIANRSGYMKYLNAMNEALNKDEASILDHLGNVFGCTVTNTKPVVKKTKEGTEYTVTYANLAPSGIGAPEFFNPADGQVYPIKLPETAVGTYGPAFDWDEPTEEAWKGLKPVFKKAIKAAVNFEGSPIQALLAGMPEENDEPAPQEDEMPDNTPPQDNTPVQEDDDIPV